MTAQRVLGAIRQSKTRDRALSPQVQRKAITTWADDSGATIATVTVDLSTSGATSAFKRTGLGPYLTDPDKIAVWDVLVVTKLDRACRNLADYLRLSTWCDNHGKRLVVLDDPSLDTSTPQGRAMANMRATFAEYEREMAKARNKERYEELKMQGRWVGGRVNYGYRYDRESQHLVPDEGDEGTADTLRTMAEMAIDDKSQWQIARWMNENGHLTGSGKNWTQDTVRRVLRHEATAAILGETKTAELWAALRRRGTSHGERANGRGYLGIVFCAQCREILYCNIAPERESGGYYRHLRNRSAEIPCKVRIRRYDLEAQIDSALLFFCGGSEHVEYQLAPGDDHQAAIHALEREVDLLNKITGTEVLIAVKEAEIQHLRNEPFEPDHYEPVPQGITVAEHWDSLDEQGRAAYLRRTNVRVFADKEHFEFQGGRMEQVSISPEEP